MMLSKLPALAAAITAALILGVWARTASAQPLKLLVFGDSLTAGYGLADLSDAFPEQLQRALRNKGYDVTVINAGVSGDTTTGGLSRIDWSLAGKPNAVIVELGGNDGLRGIDPKLTAANLRAIIHHIQQDKIPVLLAGMRAPPNLGRDYDDRFDAIFPEVAHDTGVLFYPFFLDGVAGVPALNQQDHIHPTPAGVTIIVTGILPSVEQLLYAVAKARGQP